MKTSEEISSSHRGALFTVLLLILSISNAAWAGDWNLKDKDGAHTHCLACTGNGYWSTSGHPGAHLVSRKRPNSSHCSNGTRICR